MSDPVTGEAPEELYRTIRACRICRDAPAGPPLPIEPNPILAISSTARLLVAGQAPGNLADRTTKPFNDPSGVRLRDWMGVTPETFYDPSRIAIVPMGFCFPGNDAKGGDLPPRRECRSTWHERVMLAMPQVELVLAIGLYAQRFHVAGRRQAQPHRDGRRLASDPRRRRPLCARCCRCRIRPGATTPG